MTAARCPFEDEVLARDDLAHARRVVVEAHLGVCAACAEVDEALERAEEVVRGTDVLPLGAVERALASLPARPALRPGLRAAGVATLVAVAAAAVQVLRGGRETPPEVAPATDVAFRDDGAPDDFAAALLVGPPAPTPADDAPPSPEGPPAAYVPPSLEDLPARVAAVAPDAADDDAALAAAVRRVRGAGTPGACALAALLVPDDPDLARRALRVAAQVRSAHLTAPLARLLDDADLGPDAAPLLGAAGTQAAVDGLVRGLDGPSRRACLAALASASTPRAFDALAERVRAGGDARPHEVLDAAVTASPALAARLVLDLAASADLAPLADRVLAQRAGDLVPVVAPLAARGDGLIAAAAVRALGAAADPASIPTLRAAGRRFALARPAAEALVALARRQDGAHAADAAAAYEAAFDVAADPSAPRDLVAVFDGAHAAAPVVAPALRDSRPSRRAAAIAALGWTRAPAAVGPLAGALRDSASRNAAIDALGRVGGIAAADALAEFAAARGADARVVRALGATGSAAAVAPLVRLARETALAVPVAEALGAIPAAESVLALADLLAEPRTARAAAEALGALPAAVVVPALVERLDEPSAAARAHRALVLVSGADLGRAPAAWRAWWDRRPRPSPEEDR